MDNILEEALGLGPEAMMKERNSLICDLGVDGYFAGILDIFRRRNSRITMTVLQRSDIERETENSAKSPLLLGPELSRESESHCQVFEENRPMRILIADDNQFIRRGIAALLAEQEDVTVCGEASDSAEAIAKTSELHPDLVLLDVSMPGGDGLETTRVLKEKLPQTRILIISQHDPKQLLPRALELGASGCIDKARLALDLMPTITALKNL